MTEGTVWEPQPDEKAAAGTPDEIADGTQLADPDAPDVPEEGDAGVGDVELEDVG